MAESLPEMTLLVILPSILIFYILAVLLFDLSSGGLKGYRWSDRITIGFASPKPLEAVTEALSTKSEVVRPR